MEKDSLIDNLRESFESLKKELGLKSNFEEVDDIFFISDHVLGSGYVSERLDRQICGRISETFMGWATYLHSVVMPNPHNILNINESKLFNDLEKKEMMKLMAELMEFVTRNTRMGVSRSKEEGKFIDDAVKFWKDKFSPKLNGYLEKSNNGWKNYSK